MILFCAYVMFIQEDIDYIFGLTMTHEFGRSGKSTLSLLNN